jgi:acetolactate synthase small subunit
MQRSFLLFNIDVPNFRNRDNAIVEADVKVVRTHGKAIFDTLSTQAFQLGYLMAVLSHVEILLPTAAHYDDRLATTEFMSALYLAGLNCFFSVNVGRHRTLSGYVVEPRACAFEAGEAGFRGLLAASNVRELNEKQWEFFRYMILEIVHSKMASAAVLQVLSAPTNVGHAARFRSELTNVAKDIDTLRNRYFEAAVRAAQLTPDFKREVEMLGMKAKAEGKSDDDVKLLVDAAVAAKRAATIEICKGHLKASLGRLDSQTQIVRRLNAAEAASTGVVGSDHPEGEAEDSVAGQSDLDVAVAADRLQHQSDEDQQAE